ncbi:MAG TPA: serine protease, partial [Planctomycetaceae bacterium]|nr:serine protease [Planctomycetaceae bacterium]
WQDRSGVVVSHVDSGSAAALAGLRPGMLIEEINRSPVSDMETFRSLMSEGKDSERLLLRVRDGEMARYIVLSWKSTKS